MLARIFLFLILTGVAIGLAMYLQRRRPDPPSAPSYKAPAQLDLQDFDQPTATVTLVVFASTTCDTCPEVWEIVSSHRERDVAAQRIDVQDNPQLHKRYKIDGVPTTLIVDAEGVVVQAFFGFLRNIDVAESIARARPATGAI